MRIALRSVLCVSTFTLTLAALTGCSANIETESNEPSFRTKLGSSMQPMLAAPQEGAPAPALETHCSPSATLLPHAMCVCGELSNAGRLETVAGRHGKASVGVNGPVNMASGTRIDGHLHAFGGIGFAGELEVTGDLYAGADVQGAGTLAVGNTMSVAGNLDGAGSVHVTGALRVRGDRSVAGDVAQAKVEPFAAAPYAPCTCDADKTYDVAKAVDTARLHNDNAAKGVSTDGTRALAAGSLELGAGRYWFSELAAVGSSRILVKGAVQIYVDGNLDTIGESNIELAPGATLDLFVKGSLRSAGDVVLGDVTRPEAFRLYVGGKDAEISFAGSRKLHGLVYAPAATLSFAGDAEIEGAILAKEVSYAGSLRVTYAPVTAQGELCEAAPAPVTSCDSRLPQIK